mmetsp:Transcript_55341/g.177465  ORF Transcript_55341/g.177465 Transcript_55341/m.177465 type:complete len:241 (+) Transcript_55341:403-1125(+)
MSTAPSMPAPSAPGGSGASACRDVGIREPNSASEAPPIQSPASLPSPSSAAGMLSRMFARRSTMTVWTSFRSRQAPCCRARRCLICSAMGVTGDELCEPKPAFSSERCARCKDSQRRNQSLRSASIAVGRSRGSRLRSAAQSSRASPEKPSRRGSRLLAPGASSSGSRPVSSRCRMLPADQRSAASSSRCTSTIFRGTGSSCASRAEAHLPGVCGSLRCQAERAESESISTPQAETASCA